MSRTRMLIIAAVALILSGIVTYLAYNVLQTRVMPEEETVQIVVAAKRLAPGHRIVKEDVKLSEWPTSIPLEDSFTDPATVIGRGVLVMMTPNEPVLESKLAPAELGAGLTAIIPDGLRAMSIQADNVRGVAGFVGPGSHVDIILTTRPPEATDSSSRTAADEGQVAQVVAENIRVLAIGRSVQSEGEERPQQAGIVTLLVTPEQAAKIALASNEGSLRLSLRNPLDLEIVDAPMMFRSALFTEPVPVRKTPAQQPVRRPPVRVAPPSPPPPPPPKVFEVEMIKGSKRSTETFQEKQPEEKTP